MWEKLPVSKIHQESLLHLYPVYTQPEPWIERACLSQLVKCLALQHDFLKYLLPTDSMYIITNVTN